MIIAESIWSRSWREVKLQETRRVSGRRPLTLARLFVIFITHPSLIILAASWAVFRESSKPARGGPKQRRSLTCVCLSVFSRGKSTTCWRTGMFSPLKLYSQILQRSVKAPGLLVVKHLRQATVGQQQNKCPVLKCCQMFPFVARFLAFVTFHLSMSIHEYRDNNNESFVKTGGHFHSPCRCFSDQSNCWAQQVYGAACVCTRTANKLQDPSLCRREQSNKQVRPTLHD